MKRVAGPRAVKCALGRGPAFSKTHCDQVNSLKQNGISLIQSYGHFQFPVQTNKNVKTRLLASS